MPAPGALAVGRTVTPAGSPNSVICARGCQLLGFYSNTNQALNIYDTTTTAAAGASTIILAATACAVGWNPFPVDCINGLVAGTSSAGVTYVFV